jgi:hypothetical protein
MTIDRLLKHAQDYYAAARVTANPAFQRALVEIGNTYHHEAEELKRTYDEPRGGNRISRKQVAA